MSQNGKLPDLQTAERVFQTIEQQAFFAKLAEFGIQPRTEEEAESITRTSLRAIELQQHPSVKQAEAEVNPFLRLEQGINAVAEQFGLTKAASQEAALVDQVALAYARDPAVYGAAMALGLSNE